MKCGYIKFKNYINNEDFFYIKESEIVEFHTTNVDGLYKVYTKHAGISLTKTTADEFFAQFKEESTP
jgi:hypothetical protein